MLKDDVDVAFEILLKEIENVNKCLDQEGEQAFKNQNYEQADKISENAKRVRNFKEKVIELMNEWKNIFSSKIPKKALKKEKTKKLKKGLKTKEDEFIIPILESLVELGGSGSVQSVLDKVGKKMKDKLTPYDFEGLPSNSAQERWKNTVQWCRYKLVKEGLLSSNSPSGIWEITPAGIKYLKEQKRN